MVHIKKKKLSSLEKWVYLLASWNNLQFLGAYVPCSGVPRSPNVYRAGGKGSCWAPCSEQVHVPGCDPWEGPAVSTPQAWPGAEHGREALLPAWGWLLRRPMCPARGVFRGPGQPGPFSLRFRAGQSNWWPVRPCNLSPTLSFFLRSPPFPPNSIPFGSWRLWKV